MWQDRRRGWWRACAVICAIVLSTMSLPVALAQSAMRTVPDALGRFTLTFPADWTVTSLQMNTLTGQVPAEAMPRAGSGTSGIMAFGPKGVNQHPAVLFVMSMPLPQAAVRHDVACEGGTRFWLPAHTAVGPVRPRRFVFLEGRADPSRSRPYSRAQGLLAIARQVSSFSYRHRAADALAGFARSLRDASCVAVDARVPGAVVDDLMHSPAP